MPSVMFGSGFVHMEKKYETRTSTIGGERVKEKKGKLSDDLGKPAMSATQSELDSYVDAAKSSAEKKKRVARVNLMKAHKKGLKAKGSKVPKPKKGKSEGVIAVSVLESRLPVVVRKRF